MYKFIISYSIVLRLLGVILGTNHPELLPGQTAIVDTAVYSTSLETHTFELRSSAVFAIAEPVQVVTTDYEKPIIISWKVTALASSKPSRSPVPLTLYIDGKRHSSISILICCAPFESPVKHVYMPFIRR